MIVEILIVGLIAIVTSGDIDCQHPVDTPGTLRSEPFDVVLLDGGLLHMHEPWLWIRVDGLRDTPTECYSGHEDRPGYPTAREANCTSDTNKKWARTWLAGKELRLPQSRSEQATLQFGFRKLTGRCWAGGEPQADTCYNRVDECEKDVSWLPEYAKVSGQGRIRKELLEEPERAELVTAILRDVRGRLEAAGVPNDNDTTKDHPDQWKWGWNFSTACSGAVPEYKQVFAAQAMLRQVNLRQTSIYLVDMKSGAQQTIALNDPAKLVLSNLPPADHPPGMKVGDRCYLPHLDLYAALLESPPTCRRLPEVPTKACSVAGLADSFCPPLIVGTPRP